ncbi:MAG: S41 family peptidase [Chloroflexi bacterium]|nr:S41 family peptidase [Chloroflexota bacterium]
MDRRSTKLAMLMVVCAVLAVACSVPGLARQQPTPAIPIDLPLQTQEQLRDYDLAVKTVREGYIDNQAFGTNWQAAVSTYRDRVRNGVDATAFYDTLDELLATLNDEDLTLTRPQQQPTATTSVSGTFSGIGVMVSLPERDKDRLLVLAVYPGSPAGQAGLQAHDAIVQIDGHPVTYDERATVTSRIRGQDGTEVTLTVRTPGQPEREVTLTRRPITPSSLMIARRVPNTNIGYILPDYTDMDGMRIAMARAFRDLSSHQTLDGVILDLRTAQSPIFPIEDMLGLFANAQVGNQYTRAGKTKVEITGKNIAGSQELPLVILVSDLTRGSAESLAGMLQELGRARVIGTRTAGRVALQTPVVLPNTGAQLLIPAGEYRGVKDQSWYRKGVTPDITSDQSWEAFTDEDDPQVKQAVQILTQ